MRAIKFRAWDKEANTMRSHEDIFKSSWWDGTSYFDKIILGEPYEDWKVDFGEWDYLGPESLIIMQYTGLRDKHGVEIYEGDIVELTLDVDRDGAEDRYYNIENQAVTWDAGDGCWFAGDSRLATYVDDEDWEHRCEVIGNIYSNPELLKEIEE